MEQWRLFVAIELPDDVRQELGNLQEKLRAEGIEMLKWVSPQSLHITLKFLGDVDPARITGISRELDTVSGQFSSFSIGFKGLGTFPSLSCARVLWVGLAGELGRLKMIAGEVERKMSDFGFEADRRPFVPHLTLGRVRPGIPPAELRIIAEVVGKTVYKPAMRMRVNDISLMRSCLSPVGASYNRLHSARLQIERNPFGR
ncbi:MAG: RNA 2',3'-cyclic phosphodiesterase [Dehalococcoidales bacterium]|nr:RNA 2',3'-cyclic phosphodiesterase [Dehalococcoidales bacterium]